ncbi:hypothetical protein SR914_09615 [Comamonas testosteroni]|jgi:hypothetical protein|uniref:Uncharacterized protein n=2 Tax=Comamonas testosteroni TaxID=285 RepID=B7WR65_COMTK|nr:MULTISPECIES: hypothetical protein [Comamonas]AIJ49308.1 hypothetical protein O987_26195 [Comamonas testosteroni TK102]EED65222.1 conserved hypothetical protein [Comamonas testosteroni KF-1]MPS89266.1 hypothetical protein [Comamonas sp.]TYK70791.1 hypothetical protein FSY59_14680 [Comamonas sp. Z3]WQG68632.1 hypothetical protein SR914_09615 [Comamonas testosteroni]
MPANRFLPDEWENRLEEIDLEILHQAAICKIRLLEPGAVERVLANDASICGATHETAFRTLRGLLYLHYTEVLHISEVLSPEIAQVIADRVREHLRRRSGTQSGA